MKTNGNDAAHGHGAENGHCCGLTKREHFAAMALQGFCSREPVPFNDAEFMSDKAVQFADALIDALNKEAK